MCGICGIYDYSTGKPVDKVLIRTMTESIIHRGPDDEGFYFNGPFGMGQRRLSIIDLKTGQQPMSNWAENIWIVFNGEIYNFPDLKRELEGKGHHFRTTSDTEVIICMYEEYGEKAFARLNGMFAFAIYDKRKRCIILVRDHFGVKPLYYTLNNGSLIFGSEIKAIFQNPSIEKEIDYSALTTFLTFRYNPSPQTLFKGIKKLPPGHYLKIFSNGEIDIRGFWNYRPSINNKISEQEAIEEYQRLLEQAVKRQMISDVPVGLLLSGGIDSAVIGHLMQKYSSYRTKTFTVGFEGIGDFNELVDARKTSEYIKSDHHDLMISQTEYLDFFYKSFYYTEEPIAEPTIPALYYVSKLATSRLKVVLAGQGADEPLAGYSRYFGERLISKYADLLNILPLNSFAKFLPRNERFKRAAYASQFKQEKERFLAIHTIFTPQQKEYLLNDETKAKIGEINQELFDRLYDQAGELKDSLSKLLFIDTRMCLSDDLLLFGDKMSMANSLEMRVPFLDVDLIKFLESLPSKYKLKGHTHKYIHKCALKKWLPYEIIQRKKRGFQTPIDEWLQVDLASRARALMNDKKSACRYYFNIGYINQMIDLHQSRRENYRRHIFALLSFELWHKNFFADTILGGDLH